jgi:hypothetical protein
MKPFPMFFRLSCAVIVIGAAEEVRATKLTFQIYNDAAKTTLYADNFYGWNESDSGPWPNTAYSYGDYVSVFNDPTSHGGKYFTYEEGRGATPDISVLYRPAGQGSRLINPATFGPYGDLQNGFIYDGATTATNNPAVLRFTPSPTTAVQVASIDIGSFNNLARTPVRASLALYQDYVNPSNPGTLLWYGGTSASGTGLGDVTYSVPAGSAHLTFTVPLTFSGNPTHGAIGHPVSLVFHGGTQSGNLAYDNIVFWQEVPEPSAALLLLGSASLALYRARRSC